VNERRRRRTAGKRDRRRFRALTRTLRQLPEQPATRRPTPAAGRRGFKYWVNHPKVAAAFLIMAGLVMAVIALGNYSVAAALRDQGLIADGVVTEVHGGRYPQVVVVFDTQDGRHVEAYVDDYLWDPEPRVGDPAKLLYDPEEPDESVQDARLPPDFFGVWLLGALGAVAAGLGVAFWLGRLCGLFELLEYH
jgi:uncharacterized protein DUF3592